jgi:hypothetical protein
MKNRSLVLLFLLIGFCFYAEGQTPSPTSKLVKEKFDKVFISQNFDSASATWSTVSNNENLFLMQDGEYILNRKSLVSPFAVMANLENSLTAYRFVTSLKLLKTTTDDGSIGVIFMAQAGGQGGFILDINKNQQFRIRQINGNAYRYITGNAKEGGWIKSSLLKGLTVPNLIDIRYSQKNYDLYLNSTYVMSFSEIAYKSGDIGLLIGAGCKGSVDFIYIFTNDAGENLVKNDTQPNSPTTKNTSESDVAALAESIISLKTQINKLSDENNDLKQIIETQRSSEKENDQKNQQNKLQQKLLNDQIKQQQKSIDSLIKINTDLIRYKEMVEGNDGGDLVINLSKNLKNAKNRNDDLTKENQALKDSLNLFKKNMMNVSPSSAGQQKENNDSIKHQFTLPKEN